MKRFVLWLCVLVGTTVEAAADLSADFESGTLLTSETPRGPWTTAWLPSPANTLSASSDAAHRGQRGLRLVDQDASSGTFGQNSVSFDTYFASGDYFFRFWLRLTSGNDVGDLSLTTLADATDNLRLAAIVLRFSDRVLTLEARNGAQVSSVRSAAPPLAWGQWYLIELGMKSVGSAAGTTTLWVDGVKQAEATGLDWVSESGALSHISLGGTWAVDRRFVGIIDFDDARATRAPPASRWAIDLAPGPLVSGACVRFDLRLQNADATVVTPPEEAVVPTVSVEGGRLFSDAACEKDATPWEVSPAAPIKEGYVRVAHGQPLTLAASSEDFLRGARSYAPAPGAVATLAELPSEIEPGESVVLDATGSAPSTDASILLWQWSQLRGPSGVPLEAAATQNLTFTEPGSYVFQLRVKDSKGSLSEPAFATLTVKGSAYRPSSQLSACAAGGAEPSLVLLLALLVRRRSTPRPSP